MRYKLLVTSRSFGKTSDAPIAKLQAAGFEIVNMGEQFDAERFEALLPQMDALIIGAHALRPELLDKCKKLRIICKHGVGVDNIPLEKAHDCGIIVANAPGANSQAVADLAFGLMLDASRGISRSAALAKAGLHKRTMGRDVWGKTLGILGFGRIGQALAKRAEGFDMCVLAYDPYLRTAPEDFQNLRLTELDELLSASDFVSVHLPLNESTQGFINAERIAKMKKDAVLINTSRGAVVDEDALCAALRSGMLRSAGLDVTAEEPVSAQNPLLELENVVVTDHIGMYSLEATEAVGMICAEAVIDVFEGREPKTKI